MGYTETRNEITAKIKEQADIVRIIGESVSLKRSGTRFLGLCPFHGEKTPSFSVDPGQQFYHCFGCGESGDVFSFMMKRQNLDFPGAVKELARRYNIQLPEKPVSREMAARDEQRKQLYAVNSKAAGIYREHLQKQPQGAVAKQYLEKRGIPADVQESFQLGYAPSGWNYLGGILSDTDLASAFNAGLIVKKDRGGSYDRFRDRILFPLSDLNGRIIGFGGRIVGEGQPKYMNSPESQVFNKSNSLFGLFQQKEAIRKKQHAILVEGNFDLLSLVVHGCDNVCAPLGTALTRQQLKLIKRFADKVTLLFDGDSAGIKAAIRSVPLFLAEQINGRVALLPEGEDPDTYIRGQGLAKLEELVNQADSLTEFFLEQMVQQHGLTLEGKSRIVEELKPLVEAAPTPLQRSVVLAHFSEKLAIPLDQLSASLMAGRKPERQKSAPVAVKPTGLVEALMGVVQEKPDHFMVLHPMFFDKLKDAGLRDILAGTVAEILFLQIQEMMADGLEHQPEDLLAFLPEGAERTLVTKILSQASKNTAAVEDDNPEKELEDQLGYLRRKRLKRKSLDIQNRIGALQQNGDFSQLNDLLREKHEIDRQLHDIDKPDILLH